MKSGSAFLGSASMGRALHATSRESDSGKGWNPLYELVGRHVSQYGKERV